MGFDIVKKKIDRQINKYCRLGDLCEEGWRS